MTAPKVTVLMSVLNGEEYLVEAIDSVLAQTFTDFEFLIVDNASTDATPRIIAGYEDPRVVCLRNAETLTLTQALLNGFGVASNLVTLRQARADALASAYELRGFVTSLVADVESTYWNYLGTRRRIEILDNAVEVAERQSEEARLRIEAGTVARVEQAAFAAEAARRTHTPRSGAPRTTAKGVFTGRNLALLLTPIIASLHTYTVAFSFEYTLTKTSTEKLVGEDE